ncbi:MAG: PQQ-binding-like beta-propeller repeat protein [Pseudomonadota bacterium]
MHTARVCLAVLTLLVMAQPAVAASCDVTTPNVDGIYSDGWGFNAHNHRLQQQTEINAGNVSDLALAWTYAYANTKPRSMPLVTRDTIFVGDTNVGIVALDRNSGCVRWISAHEGEIASAILPLPSPRGLLLLFTDRTKGVYAIRADNGAPVWHTHLTDEAVPFYSGTPLIADNGIFVPLSSLEIGLTLNPLYGCCTTSGGMAALDRETGEKLWYTPTIAEEPRITGRRLLFIEEYGPSGAPVWGAPMYDPARNTVYFGSGQNYSHPTTATSDAIIALDASTGATKWIRQFTANDAYNISCGMPISPNCPEPMGPDLDFGAPPVLVRTKNGDDILIAGQKSGDVHAMNPDTGAVVWSRRLGRGGALGGIHWGIAANENTGVVFVPISDIAAMSGEGEAKPGMFALSAATGDVIWEYLRKPTCEGRHCSPGFSAAITATPDLVFAGALDGVIEAVAAADGRVLWSYDTKPGTPTVNGVPASGGAIDAHGPMVAGNQLIVSSGYGSFGEMPGNALMVFSLKTEATR